MDTIAAIHGRRAVRAYQDRAVPRELIEAVIWDAVQAPPPVAGMVPWTFHVIQGAERIAALGARALQYARDHRPPDELGWGWTTRAGFEVFWGAPVVIIICGRLEDCCRAGQNLMLSAHARGLGSCWVGAPMLWLAATAVRAELGIAEDQTPAAVLCLGYGQAVPPPKPRARPVIIWDHGD